MTIPVIVVDPDVEYRELTLKTLEGSGQFKALSAATAHEAAEALTGSKVQIAIVDMDVAQDQGDIFLRQIREENRHLLLIAIVGNSEVPSSLLEELDVAAVIEKPYFLPELPSIIQNLIHPPTTKPPADIQTDSDADQLFEPIPDPAEPAKEVNLKLLETDPARVLAQIPAIEDDALKIEAELVQPTPTESSADILSALEPTADIHVGANGSEIAGDDVPFPLPSTTPESDPMGIDTTQDSPHWLDDRAQAVEYLTQLFQSHSARGLILLRDGELWAWSQNFDENWANLVADTLHEHEIRSQNKESIFRYLRFEGEETDYLLYALHVISTYSLALIYDADKPFSLARRQAKFLGRLLSNPDPSDQPLADPIPVVEDRDVPEGQDQRAGLPDDWVPLAPASDEGIPILADLDVPPPDPEPEIEETQDSSSSGSGIPSDWHPKRPMPATHLPFLDVDEPISTAQTEQQPFEPEREHNLPFTAILLPRSPQHQLNETTSEKISDWTRNLCLAWGWEAEIIEVLPDHMRLTLNLSPDIAPSQAIKHITIDTSTRLIEAFPEQYGNLPSGQFWSNHYFLSSGKDISADQLQSFIEAAHKAAH